MKKITLTSILALCMACPAMANIDKDASTATCDNATIGTTTGPANLQADWTANTIHLDWYSEDSKLTVGSTSATCTYDGGITLPSTPTVPTGYTFGGWKVRAATASTFDLSTLASSVDIMADTFGFIRLNGLYSSNPQYGLTEYGDWASVFSYGIVRGVSRCSLIGAELIRGDAGNPTDDLNTTGAKYCWCKVTSFDADKDYSYVDVMQPSWHFNLVSTDAENCADACAFECGSWFTYNSEYRAVYYGVTQ